MVVPRRTGVASGVVEGAVVALRATESDERRWLWVGWVRMGTFRWHIATMVTFRWITLR